MRNKKYSFGGRRREREMNLREGRETWLEAKCHLSSFFLRTEQAIYHILFYLVAFASAHARKHACTHSLKHTHSLSPSLTLTHTCVLNSMTEVEFTPCQKFYTSFEAFVTLSLRLRLLLLLLSTQK